MDIQHTGIAGPHDPSWVAEARELGRLYATNRQQFQLRLKTRLEEIARARTQKGKFRVLVLSDRMSGDSRLVGLYTAYMGFPILYFVTQANLGKHDFTAQYLEDLGVPVIRCVVEDSHNTWHEFDCNLVPGAQKATMVTEIVAELLQKDPNPYAPDLPDRDKFLRFVRELLRDSTFPTLAERLLTEQRPVLVVWTKSKAVPNIHKGRPEHLLGNTGTAQVLKLAQERDFATAIAGDLLIKQEYAHLIDYDLRYVGGGAMNGLSLKAQYGLLQHVNFFVPLVHIAMRSGQIEPLPLLGMRTVYLEELGSKQGPRMQQLETALPNLYTRQQFDVPPTVKGRFREAVNYYFDWNVRKALIGTAGQRAMEAVLNAIVHSLGDSGGPYNTDQLLRHDGLKNYMWTFSTNPDMSNDIFRQFKKDLNPHHPTAQPVLDRGFYANDLTKLGELLAQLKVLAMVNVAYRHVQAISLIVYDSASF